ncbi:uncharacterized protein BKCO1_3000233 [Diplodia corticola]|uniref:Uncharacterized protein n=1 Tax=Diplodia corticola TaxID=236234 RepID=A0A1J9SHG6_9PEZI|nr:uncharacterized protein BKCO1_3000233 [Diplodia corticola]OJD39029.1 hypothetical protein BKCO1_3000233 [Diplodia corticola]
MADSDPTGSMSGSSTDEMHVLYLDHIKCSWNKTSRKCIPKAHRPNGPLPKDVTKNLSLLSVIAPGDKGLLATQSIMKSMVATRIQQSDVNTPVIQAQDLLKALEAMPQLLTAVSNILKARRKSAAFLCEHGFNSDDPIEWPPNVVMVLGELVKKTGQRYERAHEAGYYLTQHYKTRLQKDGDEFRTILESDVREAINSLEEASTQEDLVAPNTGDEVYSTDLENTNATEDLYTTGSASIFEPTLPPLEILKSIGQIYYKGKRHDVLFKVAPTIISYEMACKGMYHDNRGSNELGTFLKHDRRKWSYANWWPNWRAIVHLENRFGKPFFEIFDCADIQADQALRMAEGVLTTLDGITRIHGITDVEKLRNVCADFFTKYPVSEKAQSLTSAGVRKLSSALNAAKGPDSGGVRYKGWPSLGGEAAGPATPLEDPTPTQVFRPSRDMSSKGNSEQATAKKAKPGASGSTTAFRESYVINHIPNKNAMMKAPASGRRAPGPAAVLEKMAQKGPTTRVPTHDSALDRTLDTTNVPARTSTTRRQSEWIRTHGVRKMSKRALADSEIDELFEEPNDVTVEADRMTIDNESPSTSVHPSHPSGSNSIHESSGAPVQHPANDNITEAAPGNNNGVNAVEDSVEVDEARPSNSDTAASASTSATTDAVQQAVAQTMGGLQQSISIDELTSEVCQIVLRVLEELEAGNMIVRAQDIGTRYCRKSEVEVLVGEMVDREDALKEQRDEALGQVAELKEKLREAEEVKRTLMNGMEEFCRSFDVSTNEG